MIRLSQKCKASHSSVRRGIILNNAGPKQRYASTKSRFFEVSEEVQQAVAENRPVVALESTIYTHGFPHPDNQALAFHLESLVRVNGGVPATVGVLDGICRVGLGANELIRLVSSAGQRNLMKISRRDLGFVCGMKDFQGLPYNGGTTVAATMILAHMAGIKIFATGGLGGVHRGAEQTFDVSADLTELGRTPVAVISSGCKSFLDIPKTIEYLETQGVAVATFADGRTGSLDFPAFYSRESGIKSPATVQNELEAAQVIHAHFLLGLNSGLHFANPIPEEHSIPVEAMEAAIYEAVNKAGSEGMIGSLATPYILAKIKELTGNKSVIANRALVEANVVRGTKVAKALSELEREAAQVVHKGEGVSTQIINPTALNHNSQVMVAGTTLPSTKSQAAASTLHLGQHTSTEHSTLHIGQHKSTEHERKADIFVAGSVAVDLACDYTIKSGAATTAENISTPALHTSNPARITQSLGGVSGNVARAAHLMGARVHLCSAVGDDLSGKSAVGALRAAGISTGGIKILPPESGSRTAQYVAVNDSNKGLHLAMADMTILESMSTNTGSIIDAFDNFWLPQLRDARPSHLVVDGNWPPGHLARWLETGRDIGAYITFEPVSNVKSASIFKLPQDRKLSVFPASSIHLATPNSYELASIHDAARENGAFDRADWWEIIDALGIPHSGARVQFALATSSELVDQGIPQRTVQLLPFIPSICTKLGAQGVLLTQIIPANDERLSDKDYTPFILSRCRNGTEDTLGVGGVYMRLFPSIEEIKAEEVESVNGVGDTFAGTLVAGLAQRGKGARVEDLVDLAQRAAVLTLKSRESVSPGLGTLRILL